MKKQLLFLCLMLLPSPGCLSLAETISQTHTRQISEQEKQEVEAVAKSFVARLQQTRDLAPLLKEFYLSDFLKRNVQTAAQSSTKFITLNFAPEFPIKPVLIHQASLTDWQELYVGYQNLKYFMVLTIATLPEKSGVPQNEIFPPEVEKLLKSQTKLASSGINTLKKLRRLNATLKQACATLRAQFNQQPPESSAIYHQRIGQFIDQHGNVMQAGVYVNPQADSGFPSQTPFFHIITAAPFLELRLVRTTAGLKIIFARMYLYN